MVAPVRFEPRDPFVGNLRPLSGQVGVQKAMSNIEKVHGVFHNDHRNDIRSKSAPPVGSVACQIHTIHFTLTAAFKLF